MHEIKQARLPPQRDKPLRLPDQTETAPFVASANATEVCGRLAIAPADSRGILRYLGYPAHANPAPRIAENIDRAIQEAIPSLQPRGIWALYPVGGHTSRSLKLGETTITGNIGEYLSQADRVAVFVVTAGEEISLRAEDAAKQGDAFSSWAMDAVGSWAAEAAADALMQRIRGQLREGEDLTLRYSPGYCGMEMRQQTHLFQLVQAELVGVRLLPSKLMYPLKSISGLVGLAPKDAVAAYRSPCDLCPRTGCPMRR